MAYEIVRASGNWRDPFDGKFWQQAHAVSLTCVRPESSGHHPGVQFKAAYDDEALYVRFKVADRYVVARAKKFQDGVCKDSCVEFFVEPDCNKGYLNFETSCNGTKLIYYVIDARHNPEGGFSEWRPLTEEEGAMVQVDHTLSGIIDPEITDPCTYEVALRIPFELFRKTHGCSAPHPGSVWRANVYKCADKSSHPHWLSLLPVSKLNFHMPEHFGEFRFL